MPQWLTCNRNLTVLSLLLGSIVISLEAKEPGAHLVNTQFFNNIF